MRPGALALVAILLATGPVSAERLDGIAAVVGDDVVLISELDQASAPLIERIAQERGSLAPEQVNQIRKESLERLINDQLIAAVAERNDVTASEEEVDTAIKGIAHEEGVTVDRIYQAAAEQGLSRERYRKELASQISRMKVISRSVRSRVTVSDAEVRELYQRRYASLTPGLHLRARHILLPWRGSDTPETRAELRRFAGELRQLALKNGDFAALARKYSALPSAAQGGFTMLRQGDVSREIAEQVFELKPGAISEPIETEHGLNLFQVIDRFDPSKVKFEDVREFLHAELVERKTEPEFDRWIKELREQRYIGIVLPELR